jgi:hypothetical protein
MPLTVTGTQPERATIEANRATGPDLQTDTITIPVKLCNLPPFNGIATQVLALTSDADIDLKELSLLIEGDPAFAAEILFLANSSLFGFAGNPRRSLRAASRRAADEGSPALAVGQGGLPYCRCDRLPGREVLAAAQLFGSGIRAGAQAATQNDSAGRGVAGHRDSQTGRFRALRPVSADPHNG